MAKRIALFNPKGGVSKTTTTFNLGWMLAQQGNRVILVDGDPQSNLTGLVVGYGGSSELEEFYSREPDRNFRSGLAPAFESSTKLIEPVDCYPTAQDGLFLLPGHIDLAEYEVTLGIAQELSGSIHTLKNLPGSISHLLQKTAEHQRADYVLIDTNPSLSAFNQNLLMTSDYFIIPTTPDFYSVKAIDSLSKVIPGWRDWSNKAQKNPALRNATYPFPHATPKFLGSIIQSFGPWNGHPSSESQLWVDKINSKITNQLVPALRDINMAFCDHRYEAAGLDDYCLAMVSDFSSLITVSPRTQTPVSNLTAVQIRQGGTALGLGTTEESQHRIRQLFARAANEIIALTDNAGSN